MGTVDTNALFKIGYGLYVITSKEEDKHNGLIVNTVMQVTNTPNRVAVAVNKTNYSHDIIKNSGIMNVNVLNTKAPFSVFERFGFKSGRDTDKFENLSFDTSSNGLAVLKDNVNAFLSLKVENYIDVDTHGMFICTLDEAQILNNIETMTYDYYQNNVKPKKQAKKKGYICKICGYVYEGEELPSDFICPLCKHPASDFEPIQ